MNILDGQPRPAGHDSMDELAGTTRGGDNLYRDALRGRDLEPLLQPLKREGSHMSLDRLIGGEHDLHALDEVADVGEIHDLSAYESTPQLGGLGMAAHGGGRAASMLARVNKQLAGGRGGGPKAGKHKASKPRLLAGIRSLRADDQFEQVRKQLLELEEDIPWGLVRATWRGQRGLWRKILRQQVVTVPDMVVKMVELRDALLISEHVRDPLRLALPLD